MATTEEINIQPLYIPSKQTGNTLTAVEFNKIPEKVNEIIDVLNETDSHITAMIEEQVSNESNIKVMTTEQYLSLAVRDTRVIYICVDNGVMTSVNAGDFTIASLQGEAIIKGFAYAFPIIL